MDDKQSQLWYSAGLFQSLQFVARFVFSAVVSTTLLMFICLVCRRVLSERIALDMVENDRIHLSKYNSVISHLQVTDIPKNVELSDQKICFL